jgi:peptidoglycan/LPS O-acetylase OafA/YrhL
VLKSARLETCAPAGVMPFAELRRVISGHIPALDGLRGIAILAVVLFHFYWPPFTIPSLAKSLLESIAGFGWVGVDLFFVLSGFLITGILLDSKGAENYFSSFYARRALRILPLAYGMIFLWFVLAPLLGKLGVGFLPTEFSPAQLWYWSYAVNWAWLGHQKIDDLAHFWSLAVEEQFYLVWPCIVLIASRRALARITIILALAGPIVRLLLWRAGLSLATIYVITFSHLDPLCLGALAALIVRDEVWARRLIPRLNDFLYPGLAAFVLLSVGTGIFGKANWMEYSLLFPLSVFFAALLLRSVVSTGTNSRFERTLTARWLRAFGKYSYAIYVIHFPVEQLYAEKGIPYLIELLRRTSMREWIHHLGVLGYAFLLLLVVAHMMALLLLFFLAGKLSWKFIEGPINNRKKYFKPRWPLPPQPLPPTSPQRSN